MEKLKSIIVKIFKVAQSEITDEMSPATIPDWDSVNYLVFIAEVEKEFNLTFTIDEVFNFKNLGDIKAAMRSRGVLGL